MPLASIPSPSQGVWYLGFVPIRAYALCIVLGVVLAVWLSERRWRARGGQPGTMIDIAVPAVIFGLIGGRLYHVITDWQTYFGARAIKEPYQALFIWEGGLGIWGAVALGGVGVWLACRRRGLSLSAVADTVAPGIAFAQAIGRWGNWFNQELYGAPTTLPWGLEIDVQHGGEPGVLYHPTFLYESLWNLALGIALIIIGKRLGLRHGRLFALYVAGYTLGRFWIEGLRIDPVGGVDHAVEFFGLRINQYTAIVLFVGALIYFWVTRNKTGEESVIVDGDADPAHPSSLADSEHEVATSTATAADSSEKEDKPEKPAGEKEAETEAPVAGSVSEPEPKAESVSEPEPKAEAESVSGSGSGSGVESESGAESGVTSESGSEHEVKASGVPEEKNSR